MRNRRVLIFRLLVFDAIERVEVAIRNDLILGLAVEQGPFGYLKSTNLPNMEARDSSGRVQYSHDVFISNVRKVVKREIQNANPVVTDYRDRYTDGKDVSLPYWMLLEVIDFGTLTRIFHGAPNDVKSKIAHKYGLKKASIIDSWLDALRSARNSSGHHQRLWNRKNVLKPEIPNKKNPEWHEPVEIENLKDRAFGTLTILKYLLGYIAPQSGWADRLEALFAKHPLIDRKLLGYPENWHQCPIWASYRMLLSGTTEQVFNAIANSSDGATNAQVAGAVGKCGNTVSRHTKKLREAGLIIRETAGRTVLWRAV